MSAAFVCGPGVNGGGHWPDVENGDNPCCYESSEDGPAYCSCWEPVYEVERQPLQRDLKPGVRPEMCVDCAYRPSSPERTGDPNASGDADLLQELVERGQPFWCHQGVRRPIHWRHPSGATFEPPGMEHNYDYRIVDGTPYKADGTPAGPEGVALSGGVSQLGFRTRDFATDDDEPRETVDHPPHYNRHPSGIECIDVVEHMGFNLGNAIKYLWRADHKGDVIEDLRKAAWYVQREIARREATLGGGA